MEEYFETPRICFCTKPNYDTIREVVELLIREKIPYHLLGPTRDFPSFEKVILDYGPIRYHGVKEIERFVEKWKNQDLPDISKLLN